MDTSGEKQHPHPHLIRPEAGAYRPRRPRDAIRTCVPALSDQAGYREPAEPDGDPHIVRGED